MIESLHVSGFKLFRDITLPELGRLNLFVGENNTGKSCLLEAINIYAGRNPVVDILQIAARRSASRMRAWGPRTLMEEGTFLTHPVFDLFSRVGEHNGDRIAVEEVGDSRPLHLELQILRTVTNEEGVRRYVPMTAAEMMSAAETMSEPIEMGISVRRGDKQVGLVTRHLLPLRSRILKGDTSLHGDNSRVEFLRAGGFTDERAASMWDALVQGPGQTLVLSWLRILEPRIEDLAYIAGRLSTRIALLKVEGQGRLPLRTMGDGLTKLFHIALAVASAPRGVLLIDEFENGLHWSVQEKLWKALATAAREYNVQVFATTHSRDCIESFAAAAKDAGTDGALIYRLEGKDDDVIAMELPLLNVDAAIRQNVEVR